MAWRTYLGPIEPPDEYEISTGMAPDPLGRDLLLEIEREDREREYGPSDEALVNAALYGTRSGDVGPATVRTPPTLRDVA
jgi:hypothetical protein